MEIKDNYKTSTAIISWIQWNDIRITSNAIYRYPFLTEMRASKKISTGEGQRKIY